MKASIVTIGDEILIGQIIDTNSGYIAKQLDKIGISVIEMRSISDDKNEILGLEKTKGTSYEKADINLSFLDNQQLFEHQGTSIKSFLGGAPTLLNASQATNFIFKVNGLPVDKIDAINAIQGGSKIKDRLLQIENNGGHLEFFACENSTYEQTLRKTDSKMPEMIAEALLGFFKKKFKNS